MALKVSNETKVGALTAIAITLFILGFNFLKGKDVFARKDYVFAKFNSVNGLVPSNPVIMNGFPIGTVFATQPGDENLNTVLVTIHLKEQINIPANSVATIKSNPLGTPALEIIKGDATTYIQAGDTLRTDSPASFFGSIFDKLGPTQEGLNRVLGSADTLMDKLSLTLDDNARQNLQATIASLNTISSNLAVTTAEINSMLRAEQSRISNSLKNIETFSGSMANVGQRLPSIANRLDSITYKLSQLELQQTINKLDDAITTLKASMDNLKSKDNTIGALMNDRELYDNITSTINSMNILLQDLRLHPKRYVNVSVFGKKDKSTPLMKPLAEDSITQQQYFPDQKQ